MFWVGYRERSPLRPSWAHEAHVRERMTAALGLMALIVATGVLVAMAIVLALLGLVRLFS